MKKVLCSERFCLLMMAEAVARRCSVKKVFLETSQNSHENTCARASLFRDGSLAQVFSCEFFEIAKNTFSCRTAPVAASVMRVVFEAGETLS